MATTVLGLKTFAASDPVDYNEINDNYNKIDNGVKTALQGRAAHNLLDNSDFRNPVNQRGKTSYSGYSYSIDRWYGSSLNQTVSIQNNYITVSATGTSYCGIRQKLGNMAKLAGKTVTFAAQVYSSVGTRISFLSGSGSVLASADGAAGKNQILILTYTVQSDATSEDVIPAIICKTQATGNSVNIYWSALYEGNYTADTLPAYQPKGYAAELAECQRYYRRFDEVASGFFISANGLQVEMPLNPPMRVAPTVTSITSPSAYTANGKVDVSASYASTASKTKAGYVYYSPTSVPVGTPAVVSGMIAELSADL